MRATALLEAADQPLFEALKALRFEMAAGQRVPAYVVFPDRSLIDMARLKPRSRDEMMLVHGVGQAKWDRYGAAFLKVIAQYI
jgi:ATP-dependent DNA helicase RecQ